MAFLDGQQPPIPHSCYSYEHLLLPKMSMKLYTNDGNFRAMKALVAAQYNVSAATYNSAYFFLFRCSL